MTTILDNAVQLDARGPYYTQDPRARLTFGIDWAAWLAYEGTTIADSDWEASVGLTLETPSIASGTTSVYVSGGTAGSNYTLRNTITTAAGSVNSRSVRVLIRDL